MLEIKKDLREKYQNQEKDLDQAIFQIQDVYSLRNFGEKIII